MIFYAGTAESMC